jgi:hypothetical protein
MPRVIVIASQAERLELENAEDLERHPKRR